MKGDSLESQLEELLMMEPSSLISRARNIFDSLAGNFAQSLVLFGCGPLGRRTLTGLRSIGNEPLAFVDNNSELWGLSVDGLRVFSPAEAVQKFGDRAVFVVTIYNGSGVRIQLKSMNCRMVSPFAYLFWKYPEIFMPHGALDFPHAIFEEAENVRSASSLWADDLSRQEYLAQLRWRLLLDFDNMPAPLSAKETYFPADLVSFLDDEVFVDCGAFDGDTIRSFIQLRGDKFKTILAIEPDPSNFDKLSENISKLPLTIRDKIVPKRIATALSHGELWFEATGTMASAANPNGNIKIECSSLDEILSGYDATYVKMDIEGVELDTLKGGQKTIEQGSAVWAVCSYHKQEHLWQIPLYMHSISGGKYKYFIRRYAEECWETICYAIPLKRLSNKLDV